MSRLLRRLVLSTLMLAVVGAAALYTFISLERARHRDLAPWLRNHRLIQKLFLDPAFDRLMRAVYEEQRETFPTVWDFDDGLSMAKDLFVPTQMFGAQKYRYRPGLTVFNGRVWDGLSNRSLAAAATPAVLQRLAEAQVTHRVVFQTDEHGFKQTGLPLRPGAPVVFFLGDSFTEGLWTAPEDTFASRFGRATGANVYNLGVNGYSALEMCWMLEQHAAALRPTLIVVNLFPNDVHARYLAMLRGAPVPEKNWTQLFGYLDRIADDARRAGAGLLVSIIPAKEQLDIDRQHSLFQDRVLAFCGQRGLRCVDARADFAAAGANEVYLSWDPHFSVGGHQRYARFLERAAQGLF